MDVAVFLSPATLAASAVVFLCGWAAITLRNSSDRLAEVPKLYYIREQVARKTAERDIIEQRLNELRAEIATADREKAELAVLCQQKELRALELADIEAKIASLAEDRCKIEEVQTQLAAALDQFSQIGQDVVDVEAKKSALDATIQELQVQHGQLADTITRLTSEKETLAREVARAKQGNEDAHRVLEQTKAELSDLQHRKQAEMTNLSDAQQALNGMKGELAAVEGSIGRLSQEQRDLANAITAASAEHQTINTELATLRSQAEGQQREIKRLNDEVTEAAARREREEVAVTELRHQRDALHGEIEMLKKVVGSLGSGRGPRTRDETKGILADLLIVPAALKRANPSIKRLEEREALSDVRTHLAKQGLDFSDRVINAFHTSLKISPISPLTVLAGISGTGKSELPRQYATALGVPFFQLAVQPRWDSPQDLFGFYNYLEHRYKPTELVRVMVHLDTRFWSEQAAPYKNHMALVLLDEMNLARVEYYFSEFLSRLEVRRDREDEPAAEIELELGQLSDDFNKKLYPVPRLLFVGTMNEDESTQTLSDKVVDRANVIRFARPRKLVSAIANSKEVESSNHDRMLPFNIWQSWLRRDLPGGGDRLDEWLTTLNGYMEALGRPFGHRMSQAIRAYVVNHPSSLVGKSAEPMADQLEMRLFPKLRGVDPQEGDNRSALDGIRKFIDGELGDADLSEAFEIARNRDLFLWRGVDRKL
jgi:predicted  nucleic acid-binding Zn-ribbon protein